MDAIALTGKVIRLILRRRIQYMQVENGTKSNELIIYAVKINTTISESTIQKHLKNLPIYEQDRITRYKQIVDKQRSILANLLVRNYFSHLLNEPYTTIRIMRNKYGRPFLDDSYNWQGDFNISHAGEWVVFAASPNSKVGIDIELITSIDLSIADLIFTKEEEKYLRETIGIEQEKVFYKLWTLKEAYVKAIGIGLHIPLNTIGFDITLLETENELCLLNSNDWKFSLIESITNYQIALCTNFDLPKRLKVISNPLQ